MSADKQTRSKNRKSRSDFQRLRRRFMSGLLRSLFLINRPLRPGQAGFVLPTTVLLLLVLTLTMGALSFRAFSRSGSVIALREQQVIDSAASPAIDRAKSKLEYLFTRDSRFPGGVPSSDVIASMMLNVTNGNGVPVITASDPYTFPDEKRVDINRGGGVDNAWAFPSDVNGNGSIEANERVVYSILMDDTNGSVLLQDNQSSTKANALVTRNGPINTSEAQSGCVSVRAPEGGWQAINAATLQKNFQVTAFVANGSTVNRTATAIELQQVRQADRGNKWGAWFKYDLELFPGASRPFFWNGAMHTEGNLLMRDKYVARMISSHNSCLYNKPASEVTLANAGTFEGQLLSARLRENDFSSDSSKDPTIHVFNGNGQPPGLTSKLTTSTDSVDATAQDLRDILLDPIQLFTKDKLAHRGTTGWSRATGWDNKRILNNPSPTPYLDDTYRADDRYGPKPVYDKSNEIPAGTSVGAPIASNVALTAIDPANSAYGLDGYWERRAIGQGLRIIVGQRLELGNTFGWKGVAEADPNKRDPLYPTRSNTSTEVRQRRSLYDNLAAVQGMVVYHRESYDGRLPLACIASTAHPGTAATIVNSRTFNTVDVNGTAKLNTDFFNGVGTNGWEFSFPYTTASSFANAIAATEPLGKVLRNLSYFAGDPLGGAPSFQPTQDTAIHPSPNMAAWGDFSNLRRIFASGTAYASLSPADQSTLHSAACTVGMLAYSLNNEIELSNANYASVQALGNHIEKMIDGGGTGANADIDTFFGVNGSDGQPIIQSSAKGRFGFGAENWSDTVNNSVAGPNFRVGCSTDSLGTGAAAYSRICDAADYYSQFTTTDFYRALDEKPGLDAALKTKFLVAQAILERGSQIQRDRLSGFRPGGLPSFANTRSVIWTSGTGVADAPSGQPQLVTGCDPNLFPTSQPEERVALALALCQNISKTVKYPSLYYLFAPFTHDNNGKDDTSTPGVLFDHAQPSTEEYVADPYVISKNSDTSDNTFLAVSDSDISALATSFAPRPTDFTGWALPTTSSASVLTNPDTQPFTITFGSSGRDLALLDKGMYDGREMMSLRMLDLNIEKLANSNNSSDRWISNTDGIIYAFREDAIREDTIVRPKDSGTSWADCDTWGEVYTNSGSNSFQVVGNNRNCRLKLTGTSTPPFLQDPPLVTDTNISTKPIDFYADPDRRPYGFRLVNGATLNRASGVQSGMTFVTDNTVYIKGDFNLHTATGALASNTCSNLFEEFTVRLIQDDCSFVDTDAAFYNNRVSNEANFAIPATDKWRPVEIVGDAVGVLSSNFIDGNIQDGFTLARDSTGPRGKGLSSYQNQNRLSNSGAKPPSYWRHVNPSDATTPMLIDRNGGVIQDSNGSSVPVNDYIRFSSNNGEFYDRRGEDLIKASRTIVNAVFISGIVPSQAGQSYGGMHNFPRFLEQWDTIDLHISGGFFQLNFSTSATAPFDQDAWEPGADAVVSSNTNLSDETGHRVRFYGAPNRLWGYDVALQYAPAGPIARRFVTIGRPRSEFYRELPVDDPYVANLRCAVYANGGRVYPNETPCS